MGLILDERKVIDDNVFLYEDRLKAQTVRYLESTPTYVTYYHINSDESTVDDGFVDVESLLGARSPLRYNKITDFPLYGIEQMVLSLQEEDQGLDSSYESEATILPNTVQPLQNDYFTIDYLHDYYLFRVTSIQYDTTMPDNFYRIGFRLESIDEGQLKKLNNQVEEKFTCLHQNIGTDNKCIIETESHNKIEEIDKMYNEIARLYLAIFYNDRYNCLLGERKCATKIYDPLQTQFINQHGLFNQKNNLQTYIFTDAFEDSRRAIKYEKSIYRCVELRDMKQLNNFYYDLYQATKSKDNVFSSWNDETILILDLPPFYKEQEYQCLLSDETLTKIKINDSFEYGFQTLFQKYMRNDNPLTLDDIPMDLNEEFLQLEANLDVFFFTPIIMYIIKDTIHNFLLDENNKNKYIKLSKNR